MFADDRQPAWFDVDLEFFGAETRRLSPNCKAVLRLCYFQVYGVQQFGLGTEPIVQIATEPPAIIVEDLECSASNRVIDMLDPVNDIAGAGLFDSYRCFGGLHCCCCLGTHLCSPSGYPPTTLS